MPNVSFSGLLIVAAVAFAAPLLLALTPARSLPPAIEGPRDYLQHPVRWAPPLSF